MGKKGRDAAGGASAEGTRRRVRGANNSLVTSLPPALALKEIFGLLGVADRLLCRGVCRAWRNLLES